MMNKYCVCSAWEKNYVVTDTIFDLIRNLNRYDNKELKIFSHCPWCGKKLVEEDETTLEETGMWKIATKLHDDAIMRNIGIRRVYYFEQDIVLVECEDSSNRYEIQRYLQQKQKLYPEVKIIHYAVSTKQETIYTIRSGNAIY